MAKIFPGFSSYSNPIEWAFPQNTEYNVQFQFTSQLYNSNAASSLYFNDTLESTTRALLICWSFSH